MAKTWFTADHHFGHNNVIRFCDRPFGDAAEMDLCLVQNWNAVVAPGDTVYHLGDFAYRGDKRVLRGLFESLHGTKHLILGNHDHGETKKLGWSSIAQMATVNEGSQRIVLCHYALRVWQGQHYGSIHLYGHSHGNLPGTHASLDVGVDAWGYCPVDLVQIKARLAETPWPRPEDADEPEDLPEGDCLTEC